MLELRDIYNKNFADLFVSIVSIIGFFGLISSAIIFYIVLSKDTAYMNKFKFYLLCYTVSNAAIELIILLYKPICIPRFMLIYPRGSLSPMNVTTSKILLFGIFVSGFSTLTFFLIMLIERYSAMTTIGLATVFKRFENVNIFKLFKSMNIYIFVCYLSLINISIICFLIIFLSDSFYDPEITQQIILSNVVNGSELLKFQPNLLQIDLQVYKILGPCAVAIIITYLALTFNIYYFCLYSHRKHSLHFPPKISETNKILFKSITFQFIALILFVLLPLTFMIILPILNNHLSSVYSCFIMIIWSFPVVDNFVIIFSIKPYRKFVLRKIGTFIIPYSVRIHVS